MMLRIPLQDFPSSSSSGSAGAFNKTPSYYDGAGSLLSPVAPLDHFKAMCLVSSTTDANRSPASFRYSLGRAAGWCS
jgi:hypothetical protein